MPCPKLVRPASNGAMTPIFATFLSAEAGVPPSESSSPHDTTNAASSVTANGTSADRWMRSQKLPPSTTIFWSVR